MFGMSGPAEKRVCALLRLPSACGHLRVCCRCAVRVAVGPALCRYGRYVGAGGRGIAIRGCVRCAAFAACSGVSGRTDAGTEGNGSGEREG
eukprot:2182264-Pleurochrysis_carterae.AAC.6